MFSGGLDKILTGEAGSVTYVIVISLFSLIYFARIAASTGARGRRNVVLGMALLLMARIISVAPASAVYPQLVIFAHTVGLVGLYLLFVSVVTMRGLEKAFPVEGGVLVPGIITGVLVGGVMCLNFSWKLADNAAYPLVLSFSTFAPAGFLVGAACKARMMGLKRRFLPVASGIFLVAAAALAGFCSLGFLGGESAWRQLFRMMDVAGFFVLLASAVLDQELYVRDLWASGRGKKRGSSTGGRIEGTPDAETVISNILEIEKKIMSSGRVAEIFKEIVDSAAEIAGGGRAALRLARTEGGVFEQAACSWKGIQEDSRAANPPVARDTLERYCREDRAFDGVFVLEAEDLHGSGESLVPGGVDADLGVAVLIPASESGVLRGFLSVVFSEKGPTREAMACLKLLANRMLHTVQGERDIVNMQEKDRKLAEYKEELDSVNQLKSNFLSIVSHELRTPLTSVKAYTETLMENVDTIKRNTIQDFLRVMGEENERLIKLVDNILNYSQMESGHLKVEKIPLDLNELIEEVHKGMQKEALAANVNTELRVPRHPVSVEADKELIGQLMQNLMSNAVKFTPCSGKVTVTLEEEASAARLVVQDTGKGIPEKQLEKVFERFHQADTSSTREFGGSGLGLAICKNIVEWHDGKIWVENVKDSGAKFVILLPMKDIVVRHASSGGFIGSRRFERERYLTLLTEMISEFLHARKASIMVLDEKQQVLRIIAAKGLDAEFVQNTRVEVGDRIAGHVVMNGESIHVLDIEKDEEFGRSNNSSYYATHSFVSVPMRDGEKIVGVLNVSDHIEKREFNEADKELLEALTGIVVSMLKKLEAFERVTANFGKLKEAMRSVLDLREAWGGRNLSNLTRLALAVGNRMDLDDWSLTALRLGMNLYDLGLMKVPRSIRVKKEELDREEREKLKEHTNAGYALISPLGLEGKIMKMVRSHHEHYDGTGYPDGLAGAEIPIEARIVGVVDTFRALISEGPYRRSFSLDEARNEIIRGSRTRFDPRVVGAFIKALHDLGVRVCKNELIIEIDKVDIHAGSAAEKGMPPAERARKQVVKEGSK